MNNELLHQVKFSDLPLSPELQQGLAEMGFVECTPIQAATLPLTLNGEDVAGQAQTGTGKSAAFLVAIQQRLLTTPAVEQHPNQPRALVVAPTRELAIQIHKDCLAIGKYTGLRLGLVYGGTDYEKQRRQFNDGVDILIGTPGRLIDYFKQKVFTLSAIQVVVMDEADRMFDLGFINDVRYMLRAMPPHEQRLNLLFSATLSMRVTELAYEHMNNPTRIEIEPESVTADKVEQSVYYPATEEKIPLLLGLLQKLQPERSILFSNTKRVAEQIWGYLESNGYKTAILSGDVPQNKRQQLLAQFANGEFPMLVATDVAARGLHIPDVTHVFNFDLPQDSEDYVHRIGRTARAGASGMAVSFACEEYAYSLMDIESYIGHPIPVQPISDELLITPNPPKRMPRTSHERPGSEDRSRKPRSDSRRKPKQNSSEQQPTVADNEPGVTTTANPVTQESNEETTSHNRNYRVKSGEDSYALQPDSEIIEGRRRSRKQPEIPALLLPIRPKERAEA